MPTKSLITLKKEIVEIGKRTYDRGYVAANDGNISCRLPGNRILITPTGVSKGFMNQDMLVVCDMQGKSLIVGKKASSEIIMHVRTYADRPDAQAIVHAHPPFATAFGIAGIPLTQAILPEVILTLGGIPVAEYGTPGAEDIYHPMESLVKSHDALILQNHGAITLGPDLETAFFRMETLEHFAHIAFIAKLLGKIHTLPGPEVDKLLAQRKKFGMESDFQSSSCQNAHSSACSILESNETIVKLKSEACESPVSGSPLPDARIRAIVEDILKSLGY